MELGIRVRSTPLLQAQTVKLPGLAHILLSNFQLEGGSADGCLELNPPLTYFVMGREQKMNVSYGKPLEVY